VAPGLPGRADRKLTSIRIQVQEAIRGSGLLQNHNSSAGDDTRRLFEWILGTVLNVG
jgi:hypothetical protein